MLKNIIRGLVGITLLLFLFACSQDPLITQNQKYNKLVIKNDEKDKIVFETSEKRLIEEVIKTINHSKRPKAWETKGSVFELILSKNGQKEKGFTLYWDSGDVVVNNNYVKTGFSFFKK